MNHFCTYHQDHHPIEDFGITKYGKPKSWCRLAYKEDAARRYRDKGQKELESSRAYRMIQCQGKCQQLLPLTAFDKFNAKVCISCMNVCSKEGCNHPRTKRYDREGLSQFCYSHQLEQKRQYNKTFYDRHQPTIVEEQRNKRAANPEFYRHQKWLSDQRRKEDPIRQKAWTEAQRIHQQNRRARKSNASGSFTTKQWLDKIDYCGDCCYLCKNPLDHSMKAKIHLEHMIPLKQGGTNWIANIKPSCDSCNLRKGWRNLPILPRKYWEYSHRGDQEARAIADRHYSRRKPGSRQFVQPGRSLILKTANNDALWVSMWPYAEYVRHAWPNSWFCQLFSNEGQILSSLLVKEAVALTRKHWHYIPSDGFITFINQDLIRRKRDPGRCFRKAGFEHVGYTKGGLVVLQLTPGNFPLPRS